MRKSIFSNYCTFMKKKKKVKEFCVNANYNFHRMMIRSNEQWIIYSNENKDLLQAVGSLRRKLRNSMLVHLNAEKEPCANSISSSGTRVTRIFPRRFLPGNRLEFFSTFCTDECDEFHFLLANNLFLLFFFATLLFFFFVLSTELDLWN